MENYGNLAVKVLGMFYFSWDGKTRFTNNPFMSLTVTDLLTCCQEMLVTHLKFSKPCYTVESGGISTKCEHSFLHQKMNGPEKKLSDNSTKHSITREQLQSGPLTKQDILETYADVFTRIGKFPRIALQVPTQNQMQNPLDMHQGKCLYTYKMHSMRKSGIWKH